MQAYPCFPLLSFPKGSTITQPNNSPSKRFYVVQSGIVQVYGLGSVRSKEKTSLGSGDFFSVESALTHSPEWITAIAETDVAVIAVSRETLSGFIKENLPVSTKILNYLSKQLFHVNGNLLADKRGDDLSRLYNFGKFYLERNLFRTAYCAFHQYLKYCPSGENAENARGHIDKLTSYSNGLRFDYHDREITRMYPVDSVIFFEFEPSHGMYVIRNGSIKITKIVDDKEIILAVIKAGDIVGHMGLIDIKPRSATAIACEDCELIAIAHTAYLPILKDGASILARIFITLAERIAAIRRRNEASCAKRHGIS
jgi:CRP-like cAMP-binding protein